MRRCEAVFDAAVRATASLEGMVLKPNMVISGKKTAKRAAAQEVAEAHRALPEAARAARRCRASPSCRAARPTTRRRCTCR